MAFRDAVDSAGFISDALGDDYTSDDYTSSAREPRRPRPAPRDSAVALPEPDDALDSDRDS